MIKAFLAKYLWPIRIAGLIVLLLGSGYAGWRLKSLYVAERDLAIKEVSEQFREDYQKYEAGKAAVLENTLKRLKANERIVYRETEKIIDRPVYRSECLDADGVQLIDRTRTGRADPAKPAP